MKQCYELRNVMRMKYKYVQNEDKKTGNLFNSK